MHIAVTSWSKADVNMSRRLALKQEDRHCANEAENLRLDPRV